MCLFFLSSTSFFLNSSCLCMKAFAQYIIVHLKCKCLCPTSRPKIVIQIYPRPNWEILWPFSSPVRSDKCHTCTKKTLKKTTLVWSMPAGFTCLFDTVWPPSFLPFNIISSHSCPCCCVWLWLWTLWSFEQWWSGQVVFRVLMCVKAYRCRNKYNWRHELNNQSFLLVNWLKVTRAIRCIRTH